MRYRFLWGALTLTLSLQIALPTRIRAFRPAGEPTARALEWFEKGKAPDGALPGYDNGFTPGGTADAVAALAAAGENPRHFGRKSGDTPVEYLEAHAGDDTAENDPRDDAHLAGKVALAARVSGKDPDSFGGADLVRFIHDRYEPASGGYRGGFQGSEINPLGQSLSILGLLAAGEEIPGKALDYLEDSQQADGGWEFGAGFGSDVQTSSMAVQALLAAFNASGEPDLEAAAKKASTFFREEQNRDGGFSYQKKFAANWCSGTMPSEVDSTGFAIQAIQALGEDPDGPGWAGHQGHRPGDFLRSAQLADGSFSFQQGPDCRAGNGGSTYAAVLGLQRVSFPCFLDSASCPRATGLSSQFPDAAQPQSQDSPVTPARAENSGEKRAPGSMSGAPARRASARPVPAPSLAASPSSCRPPGCSPAQEPSGPSLDPASGNLSGAPTEPGKPRQLAGGRSASQNQGSAPNGFILLAGGAIIFALAASIGRQLLKGKGSGR